MKFIYSHERTREFLPFAADTKLVVARFFFHDVPGVPLLKSHIGLLRTLLSQVLAECRALIPEVLPEVWSEAQEVLDLPLSQSTQEPCRWTLAEMKRAFRQLACQQILQIHLLFIIDGLDEFEGQNEDLVQTLAQLSEFSTQSTTRIQMCVASRPLRVFEEAFAHSPSLKVHELSHDDIRQYVLSEFGQSPAARKLESNDKRRFDRLVNEITRKAEGVFLWVILVTKSLLEGLRNDDTMQDLEHRLRRLPTELDQLFQRIFENIDPLYQTQAAELLSIVLCAGEWLSLTCLGLSRDDPSEALANVERYRNDGDLDAMRDAVLTHVKSRCGGLIEVKSTENDWELYDWAVGGDYTKVQFLHLSVKEFLVKTDSQTWLRSKTLLGPADVHLRLVAANLRIMKIHEISCHSHQDVFHHFLESLVTSAREIELCGRASPIRLLDELDRFQQDQLQKAVSLDNQPVHHPVDEWRNINFHCWVSNRRSYVGPETWKSNFLSYMISIGMQGYVLHKIASMNDAFSKDGRPLLFYAVELIHLTEHVAK